MSAPPELRAIAHDPDWFVHRYDPGEDAYHLLRLDRAGRANATFLNDDYLPADLPKVVLRRKELVAAAPAPAPIHYIFHAAFCCSTLLARAFDRPGVSSALKEPMVLQDITGWRRRGGDPAAITPVLDHTLGLLARPFRAGEAVVIKPSNILNGLADALLAMRPGAGAVLLYAPLRTYLASVAKKGMWGRLWVRELLLGQMRDGMMRLGFDGEALLGQTDLQIAAVGWLLQHMTFADLAAKYPARVRFLDSEVVTTRPAEVIGALARLYRLPLDATAVAAIARGPAFSSHSKLGTSFSAAERARETEAVTEIHGEEIEKVAIWAETVAAGAGIALPPRGPALLPS